MAKNNDFPSVLAFSRSLEPSDARMYGVSWEQRGDAAARTPLRIVEKSVRGTISNRLKAAIAKDPLKVNAEVQKPNLQKVDACSLADSQDTLLLQFSLRVLGDVVVASACNHPEWQSKFSAACSAYVDSHGFRELGRRYAANLANGRFLWRNRVGADSVEVRIRQTAPSPAREWTFDAKQVPFRDFDVLPDGVEELGQIIAAALAGHSYLSLEVDAFSRLARGQEVYPSQELILDKEDKTKSKVLYQVGGVASLHSQKIGNALRSVDTWYPGVDEPASPGPIAVEPYGSVTSRGVAYRAPTTKADFYRLFNDFVAGSLTDPNSQHYVMANIVRGGVFGE